MKKRVLSLLLCLVMALSLVPSMAYAETVTHYGVWVGGVEVTSANKKDVLGDNKVTYVQSSIGPEYGGTLYLSNGARIRGAYEYDSKAEAAIYATKPLTVIFAGDCAIDMADYYNNVSQGPNIFDGIHGESTVSIHSSNTDNTLTINMPKVNDATGIYARTWVALETFGQTVNINMHPDSDYSYGIYTDKLYLYGGVVHIANASRAYFQGVPITANEISTGDTSPKQYVYRGINLSTGKEDELSQSEAKSGYSVNDEFYDPITVEPIFTDEDLYKYMFTKFDTDGDKALSKSELAAITYLELKDISIYKLDGLRYLPNLTILYCRGTDLGSFKLKELDVTHNPKLEKLYCDRNSLTSLDVSHCPELKTLDCGYNALTALDVTHNPKLTSLDCSTSRSYTSKISELDVTYCPELTYLYCSDNDLSSLNLLYCPKLEKLLCNSCKLKSLNVEYNPKLTYLSAELNHFSTVNLANNPELTYLDLGGNGLTKLDISHNTKLQKLYCYSSHLTALDTSKCPDLQLISAAGGDLTALDVSKNTKLTTLAVSANKLTSLDVSHNPQLTNLTCHDNQLTKLDLSKNGLLSQLECYENRISELDLSNTQIAASSNYSEYKNIYLGEQKDASGKDVTLVAYTLPERVENLRNYVKSYSDHSYLVSVQEKTLTAPAAPTLSIAKADGKVKLSWNAVSGATKYWIYRSTDGTNFSYYDSTTGTSYTNGSVTSGTKYYYKVKAVATINGTDYASAYSAAKSTVPMTTPVIKASLSAGTAKLSWGAVTGATKYWIYRSTDGTNFSYYDSTTNTTYTNSSVTGGNTYYYKIKAVKTINSTDWASDYSAVGTVKVLKAPTLSISKADGKVKLSWTAVSGATKYWIYRSTDGTNFKYYDSITGTSYTNSSVTSGTKYYYKVKAVNSADGTSLYSEAKSTVPMTTPTLSATVSSGKVKLSWGSVTGATKYWIYRSTDGTNFSYYDSATNTSYTNSSVTAGKTYYYKIKAVKTISGTDWASDYSNVVSKKP